MRTEEHFGSVANYQKREFYRFPLGRIMLQEHKTASKKTGLLEGYSDLYESYGILVLCRTKTVKLMIRGITLITTGLQSYVVSRNIVIV